jgi:hypothetical protein
LPGDWIINAADRNMMTCAALDISSGDHSPSQQGERRGGGAYTDLWCADNLPQLFGFTSLVKNGTVC